MCIFQRRVFMKLPLSRNPYGYCTVMLPCYSKEMFVPSQAEEKLKHSTIVHSQWLLITADQKSCNMEEKTHGKRWVWWQIAVSRWRTGKKKDCIGFGVTSSYHSLLAIELTDCLRRSSLFERVPAILRSIEYSL